MQVIKSAVKAWSELINKQPDIFDDRSLAIVVHIFEKKPDVEITCTVLNILKHATLMHEYNRQNIMNAEILKSLQPLLKIQNDEVIAVSTRVSHFLKLFLNICLFLLARC